MRQKKIEYENKTDLLSFVINFITTNFLPVAISKNKPIYPQLCSQNNLKLSGVSSLLEIKRG